MNVEKKFDLIVIGAGPGGYVAATKAAELGMNVGIIENRELGGTCLNRGCIPTKSLMHSSNLYNEMIRSEEFGINMSGLTFDFDKIHERKENVILELRNGVEKLLKSKKVEIIEGTATIVSNHRIKVKMVQDEEIIQAEKILIATGSKPAMIPIEGSNLKNVVTSDELLEGRGKLYNKLVIIGGGVIGVEFATIYRELGSEVTIIEGQDRILPQMDKEISRTLMMSLKKKGIKIITSAQLKKITQETDGVHLLCHFSDKAGENVEVAEGVLISVGRVANTENLFGDGLSIEMEGNHIKVNENFETSIPNIYAIGDVIKGIQLAHLASSQGIVAVEHMKEMTPSIKLDTIPSCIYTNPEIATVGITQDEAKKKNIQVKVGKYPMLANGKAMISADERGYIKVIADADSNKIIGADLICSRATDMVGELAMAIVNGLTISEIASVIRPHPTYEESITEAVKNII